MQKIPFDGRLFVLGCGSVSQCTLPLARAASRDAPGSASRVLDMVDQRGRPSPIRWLGASIIRHERSPPSATPSSSPGSPAGRHDRRPDVEHRHLGAARVVPRARRHVHQHVGRGVGSVRRRRQEAHRRADALRSADGSAADDRRLGRNNRGPTAVVDHGANPGLVSHFTKMGLARHRPQACWPNKRKDPRSARSKTPSARTSVRRLPSCLGVKVIHISERDTQICNRPKEVNEFVNTWSVEGLLRRGDRPGRDGLGDARARAPGRRPAAQHPGPRNQICLTANGHEHVGSLVGAVRRDHRHGDPPRRGVQHFRFLTVLGHDGTPVYRPTVHYAYCPSDAAMIDQNHEVYGYPGL